MFAFKLPDIGEGVVEGEVVRWLIPEGGAVQIDQPMVEVMTDKANVQLTSPVKGVIRKHGYAQGAVVPVGSVLVEIETAAAPKPAPAPVPEPVPVAAAAAAAAAAGGGNGRSEKVLAAPAVRFDARKAGVDLADVPASGPAGRVTREDLDRVLEGRSPAAPTPPASPPRPAAIPAGPDEERVPLAGLRRAIAQRMAESKRHAAHFTYVEEIDYTRLVGLRRRLKEELAAQGVKLTYLTFIVKAVTQALRAFPALNAALDEERSEIVLKRRLHIGVAAASEAGLLVPVIKDADRLSLRAIAQEIERLAAGARAGKLTHAELTGSTFTITSLGAQGGLLATPVLNYPEVAILGVHKVTERPAVYRGKIRVRQMGNLALSLDHRLIDGHVGAAFTQAIKALLEDPGRLLLDAV